MTNFDDTVLQKIWDIEQEILDVFHKVCAENNLRYTLMYGTLIGAVRHKGFIPWDDDIDIAMPIEDYNKFIEIWNEDPPKGYILQNYHNSPDFDQNFTKIRKDKTTFLQDEKESNKAYHKGIFIDIFPGYRVPESALKRVAQYVACAINLLYSRGHTSNSGGVIGIIENILLFIPDKKRIEIRDNAEKDIFKLGKNGEKYLFPCTIGSCKKYYDENLFNNLILMEFNGKKYYCTSKFDEILHMGYGDYMQLPPKEERVWRHHPIIVDFERNFEDIPLSERSI